MKTLLTFLLATVLLFQSSNDNKKVERAEMLDKVFATLETEIANPKWLKRTSFKNFKNYLYSDKVLSINYREFRKAFDNERKKLSFTHFQIIKKTSNTNDNSKASSKEDKLAVSWNAIDDKIAYLKIKTFSIPGTPVVKALQEIGIDQFKNLIIDLRDNEGGNLEGPIALGRFLTQKPIDAGYYLTRKWFDNHDSLPTKEDVQQMSFLRDFTNKGIRKALAEEEGFRMVIPGHNNTIFKGKVYVLINKWTASAGEPLINILKKEKIATLVGETSNGSMLSGKFFDINEYYRAFIPIADYYTKESVKIDKVGVKPDIKVNPLNSKEYVVELINKKQ